MYVYRYAGRRWQWGERQCGQPATSQDGRNQGREE